MRYTIQISGRPLTVELSAAAEAELRRRATPLLAEMELYFSCFVRKRVRFYDRAPEESDAPAGEHLAVRFRPVMTRNCSVGEVQGEPPLTDFPIARPGAFVPHWLRIDHRGGRWRGEFGYR